MRQGHDESSATTDMPHISYFVIHKNVNKNTVSHNVEESEEKTEFAS